MDNLFAHPSITSSPELIRDLQDRLGVLARADGHRVRLVAAPPARRAPTHIESRNGITVIIRRDTP